MTRFGDFEPADAVDADDVELFAGVLDELGRDVLADVVDVLADVVRVVEVVAHLAAGRHG